MQLQGARASMAYFANVRNSTLLQCPLKKYPGGSTSFSQRYGSYTAGPCKLAEAHKRSGDASCPFPNVWGRWTCRPVQEPSASICRLCRSELSEPRWMAFGNCKWPCRQAVLGKLSVTHQDRPHLCAPAAARCCQAPACWTTQQPASSQCLVVDEMTTINQPDTSCLMYLMISSYQNLQTLPPVNGN